jgi:hypothetical protein
MYTIEVVLDKCPPVHSPAPPFFSYQHQTFPVIFSMKNMSYAGRSEEKKSYPSESDSLAIR